MSSRPTYDLAVAYRICPFMSRTPPPVHGDSKYDLAALCLRSFKAGLGSLKVKLWALLDACPPEYEALFRELWPAEDLVVVHSPGIGNAATFGEQIRILSSQDASDFVYFTEDDYVYQPGGIQRMIEFMRNHPDADFSSPYDHPDLYNHSFHLHMMRIKVEGGQVWKTANGTTCTFMTRKSTLVRARPTLMSYTRFKRWNVDACMWLSLTKHHVLNPFDLIAQPFIFPYRGASLWFAWILNWRQVIFGPRYTLWISVPSIATHMAAPFVAPFVDWSSQFKGADPAPSAPRGLPASRV